MCYSLVYTHWGAWLGLGLEGGREEAAGGGEGEEVGGGRGEKGTTFSVPT